VAIIGYARTDMNDDKLREKLKPKLVGSDDDIDKFLKRCTYVAGVQPLC
jgi:glucose-6-phosphate 1-dehydrogenase